MESGGVDQVVVFTSLLSSDLQVSDLNYIGCRLIYSVSQEHILKAVLNYAAKGFLDHAADHTNGKYIEKRPPFWGPELPPLHGCIYLSHSNHAVGQTASDH